MGFIFSSVWPPVRLRGRDKPRSQTQDLSLCLFKVQGISLSLHEKILYLWKCEISLEKPCRDHLLSSNPLHLSTPCQRHACQCVNEKSQVYLYIFVCHLLNNITWHTIFQAWDKPDSMTLSNCSYNEEKTSCYCTRMPLYCQTLWLTCGQGLHKLSE